MQLFGRKSVVITVVLCALMFASASCTTGAQGIKPGPAYSFVYLGRWLIMISSGSRPTSRTISGR